MPVLMGADVIGEGATPTQFRGLGAKRVGNSKPGTQNPELGTRNPEPGTRLAGYSERRNRSNSLRTLTPS
jgi:hypothetical protein